MSVIELDSDLVGELAPGTLGLLEAAHNIVKGRRNPKVLLLQSKFLAAFKVVVGVQDSADGFGALLVSDGALVVAAVELLEVKLAARGLARPQSKIVGRGGIVTRDGHVVCDGLDDLAAFPEHGRLAVLLGHFADTAKELNLHSKG